jgi:26S proteasome regulatory subunit T5
MLELLNQLDGFTANEKVKVIAATNRPDILDPALMRSGRLDRKIELPLPDEKARAYIMKIHSRKMNVDMGGECFRPLLHALYPPDSPHPLAEVNFEELARSTEDFNGAMLKAVCVEAGMIALRREATIIKHEDFVEGIQAVQMKKKSELQYYA